MKLSMIIARKEFRELLANRSTVLTALVVAVFFSLIYSFTLGEEVTAGSIISVDGTLFFLSVMLGVFMAFSLTGHAFYKEKTDRIIETLLSSPVTIRQIWLGKIAAVSFLSYALTLLSMVLLVIISSIRTDSFILPGWPVLAHIALVVPVFIAAFVGLNGLAQLALGMRENRFLGFLFFLPLFIGLYGIGHAIGSIANITWLYVGLVFIAAVLILGLLCVLVRFLSSERIVTTVG